MNETKIKSYIGFAIRMRKYVFGVDGIRTDKHKQYVIVYDDSLAENSLSKLKSHAEKKQIPLLKVCFSLSELTKRENVKVVAISDKSLAEAILVELEVQNG